MNTLENHVDLYLWLVLKLSIHNFYYRSDENAYNQDREGIWLSYFHFHSQKCCFVLHNL